VDAALGAGRLDAGATCCGPRARSGYADTDRFASPVILARQVRHLAWVYVRSLERKAQFAQFYPWETRRNSSTSRLTRHESGRKPQESLPNAGARNAAVTDGRIAASGSDAACACRPPNAHHPHRASFGQGKANLGTCAPARGAAISPVARHGGAR
jgi:hypothetical protein